MPATVEAIGPDFFRVRTESANKEYLYRVVIVEERVVEDEEVVERGEATVAKRTVTDLETGEETVEGDVDATPAVTDVMDERGYDVT